MSSRIAPTSSLEIPAQAQAAFGNDALIRFFDLPTASIDAFALTLTFESGKTITIAAPIIGAVS
jgi:hypothetical protein